jgi:TP901 family phage tail tape measure protein
MASDAVVEDLILAVEAMGLPEAAAAVDDLTASVDDLSASLDRADIAAGGGAAGKGGLMGAMTGMKALFAGLGIYEAVKQFAGFQSQMEKLRTQTGATQSEVGRMSQGILGMAVSVGTGPQSLAEALYHIESAGYRGQKALDALRVAAMGAKIGGAELTATTTAMTAVMVAGFKGVHTLRQAMGELNSTVGAGDMTMEDLNSALSTGILSTMKTLGLSVKDTGAALAVLGDNNIRGAAAATRLRMGLMTLVKPSETAAKAMRELGMGPLQLAEDLRKPNGLLVMLEDLKRHLGDLSPTQQASSLASIFGGGRNSAAMLTLIDQRDRLRTKYAMIAKGGRDFNSDWKATTHTLAFLGDQLKALGEVALIKLVGGITSVITKIEGFVEALKHGKTWAVALAIALGAIAATIGTVALAASWGAIVIGAYAAAWTALGVVLAVVDAIPILLLFAAIGVAVYELVTHFKQVKAVVVDAFDWIVGHWRLLLPILFGPFGLAVDFITAHLHTIVVVAEWLWGAFKTIFGAIKGVLTKPFTEWWSVVKGIAVAIVHAVSWMVDQIGHLLSKILGPLKSVAHFAGGLLSGAGHIAGDVGGFLGLASGTPAVTTAGAFLVGERGPEIVYLPKGAAVQSNGEMGASGAAGGQELTAKVPVVLRLDRKTIARGVVQVGLEAQSCT